MRPGQQNKRSRGRGRKGPSPLSRSYESNGPDVKIRGTAQHIADKYIALARDAQSSGDTVLAEAYLQHAEHYYRIVAAAQVQLNQPVQVKRADDPLDGSEDEDDDDFDPADPEAPQPDMRGPQRDRPQIHSTGDRGSERGGERGEEDGERRSRRNRNRNRNRREEHEGGPNGQGGYRADREDGPRANGNGHHDERGQDDRGQDDRGQDDRGRDRDDDRGAAPGDDERPRRAPRSRRASIDVSDRYAEAGDDA